VTRNNGFTLIEVLAALIIVSLGMLGIIQAVGQTASNSAYLRDKTFAHWVALNQLATVRLAPQAPAVKQSSGDAEMVGQKWHWTMTVTQTPIETMRRIDVSVAAQGAPKKSALATVVGFYGIALLKTPSTVPWDGGPGGGAGPPPPPAGGTGTDGSGTGQGGTTGTTPGTSPGTSPGTTTTPPTGTSGAGLSNPAPTAQGDASLTPSN
jgi:general secretion pathway protein I